MTKIPWFHFARELAGSTSIEGVLSALRTLLEQLGMPVVDVALVPASANKDTAVLNTPVRTKRGVRWLLPIEGVDFLLAVESRGQDMTNFSFGTIYPFLSLAQSALYRLLVQEVWWPRLLGDLESISALLDVQDILDTLVKQVVELFDAPEVYLFRYLQNKQAVRVEATAQLDAAPQMVSVSQVMPVDMMPGHYEVLESGQITLFTRDGSPDLSDWEWEVFFSPQVQKVMVVPFWLSTRDLGLLSVALPNQPAYSREELPIPVLRTLLHHAALAVERATLFEEVADARQELEIIVDKTLAGILLVGDGFDVQRANASAAAVWNCRPEELIGRRVEELFGEEIIGPKGPLSRVQKRADALSPIEWQINNGKSKHLLLAITPLIHEDHVERKSKDGQEKPRSSVQGYLFSFLDITHRKQLELLREQLLANVTHELRTPIAVIRGYAELLEAQLPQDAPLFWFEALHVIEQRADDLLSMVEIHLDLAQLEADTVTLRRELVNVRTILQSAFERVQRRFPVMPDVDLYVAPEVEIICADSHFFNHIVTHLLDNAVKFTGKEGRVWFRAWAEGDDVHLEVGDTGMGIPDDDLPHVFDSFYRAKNVEYGVPGSGLGLTLVKNAVLLHGGHVEISSQEEGGTVVHVVLPSATGPCT